MSLSKTKKKPRKETKKKVKVHLSLGGDTINGGHVFCLELENNSNREGISTG